MTQVGGSSPETQSHEELAQVAECGQYSQRPYIIETMHSYTLPM